MFPSTTHLAATPKHAPPLDPGFLPSALWWRDQLRPGTAAVGDRDIVLAISQPSGAVFHQVVRPGESRTPEESYRLVERVLKFLLWSRGGSAVSVAGDPAIAARLARDYAPGGVRAFDAEFLGRRIYLAPFTVTSCGIESLPPETATRRRAAAALDGCRIGFDLGGSDRKAAALIDGEVVFSEEIPWDPYFQSDPAYHHAGISESLRRAAAHLPRIDAIGGSAAGVYVDNEPRVASLFRGVPDDRFVEQVRPLFKAIGSEWRVPLAVANDGDVTALAASRMLGHDQVKEGVLGLAMGTSLAAGYSGSGGTFMPWINELAFVPIDARAAADGAPVDEWSGDAGVGVRYLSQQALLQLLPACGAPIDRNQPLPEQLVALQRAMSDGAEWARLVYDSYGCYLGYAVGLFDLFYDFDQLLVLGRVASGPGGDRMVDKARDVIADEFPALAGRLQWVTPDETFKRHGQAIAAASLPTTDQ